VIELYLMRHGIAADLGDAGVLKDEDRPLTLEGRAKMRQAAEGIGEFGLKLNLILTSPLLRARQTAEVVAEVLDASARPCLCRRRRPACGDLSGIRRLSIRPRVARRTYARSIGFSFFPPLRQSKSQYRIQKRRGLRD
jgi:broad specificity phosphatase PhoE